MVRAIRHFACAAVLAVAPLGVVPTGVANACDTDTPCCEYVRVTNYVTTYECRTRWVTVTDDYGCTHRVPRNYTVPVQVPVTRLVKVCHQGDSGAY